MTLKFDIGQVEVTEFGVGQDDGGSQTFVGIPVDAGVQKVLREMVVSTWQAMAEAAATPDKYEPSEKHDSVEHLYLPLADDMAADLRELHDASNLPLDAKALKDPTKLFCYFARMRDSKKRRLTAVRRASQFKGVLKHRLIRFATDSLKLVADRVFKLDTDFDLLIDSTAVHILRPSGFEFVGKLQEAILAAVPGNASTIQSELPLVEFSGVEKYASEHPRAARYLASIRSQGETKNIDMGALKEACKKNGVELKESKGKVNIASGHEMGFLEVLDRRRYDVELVKGKPERFRAASRKRIDR